MKAFLRTQFLFLLAFMVIGCSTQAEQQDARFLSHSTQQWNFSSASGSFSAFAESESCATDLPSVSLGSGFCFSPVPVAIINTPVNAGQLFGVCVATHLAGSADQAALVVVDSRGNYVSEGFGRGDLQVLASLNSGNQYKVYVGFPTNAAGQRVKVISAATNQFALSGVACSLK